ncbi:2-hydroxychromene-2-carboxylate isomerase, partial [Dyella silvatica]|uniref:2-hydroxychromene-2-carboxylate isomerase n=1 Tax=Dyella silvatica TaxID=2992128 RepID=UPI00225066AD
THFPRRALLPRRVAMLGADQAWMGDYCKSIMHMNFAEDRDIDTVEAVTAALQQLDLPSAQIIASAQSDQHKHRLRQQTEAAQARGIFGAPTFFCGDEMFWGNDRLEDALAYAAAMNY